MDSLMLFRGHMKYSFLVLLSCVLFVERTTAQRRDFLTFQEKVFDFGMVREEAGPVIHIFEFENTSERPIKIMAVKPSCGCTTPDWSKETVKPGSKGFVTAKFDPTSRPGFFNKTLTITTDYSSEAIVLNIKGSVSLKGDNSVFREAKGSWRLISASFNMGKVLIKDEMTWKDFEILNASEKEIAVTAPAVAPSYIKVIVTPAALKPGERGVIRIGYNGKMKNAYGFHSDNVEFITDDESMPRKSFSVQATLEDYFPILSNEEVTKAPKLWLSETALDLGRFSSSSSIEKQITLSNTGKKELSIRSIQTNCQCITATAQTMAIASGKSTALTIRFDPADRKGTQQKYITIYSNDPVNPVQRISIAAYVEK